jgi:hypothetical protein
MKNVFLQAMNELFDLSSMLGRINYHHIRGNLTDADREELIATAREKANPFGGLDVAEKLKEFDERITVLENGKAESGSGDETIEEYVPGKWYYRGNHMLFNGGEYECIAPEGVACVWSPDEYPVYWQSV